MRGEKSVQARRPGRPTGERVRADCARIAEMLSAGEDEYSIRAELKLGRKAYRHRMGLLRRSALDGRLLWARYLAGANEDLRRLSEIAEAALAADPPRPRLFIQVVKARLQIRRAIIETGQMLGVYPCNSSPTRLPAARPMGFRELFCVREGDRRPKATASPPSE